MSESLGSEETARIRETRAAAVSPRRPFTLRRMLLVVLLFALAFGCARSFGTGSAPVFFVGTVPSAALVGAALGVPFDRTLRAAVVGAAAGLTFFLYALLN
jgi:hypothetical protein